MVEVDARDVLEKYVATLRAPGASVVRNSNELAYSKDIIKSVLKGALQLADDPATRERLKIAFLDLADFQPLSDEECKAVAAMSGLGGTAELDCEALTEQVRVVAIYGDRYQAVVDRSNAEREALFFEVEEL
jgi:hypothetical protein